MLDRTRDPSAISVDEIFNNPDIRTHSGSSNSETWYCAKDIVAALGKRWVSARRNLSILSKKDKRVFKIKTKRGKQKTWFVSELGVEELLANQLITERLKPADKGITPNKNVCKKSGSTLGVFAQNNTSVIPQRPKAPSTRPPKRPSPQDVVALAKKLTSRQFDQLRDRYYWRLEEAATGERQPPALHRDLSKNPPPLLHATLLLDDVSNKELRKLDAFFETGCAS